MIRSRADHKLRIVNCILQRKDLIGRASTLIIPDFVQCVNHLNTAGGDHLIVSFIEVYIIPNLNLSGFRSAIRTVAYNLKTDNHFVGRDIIGGRIDLFLK